MSAGYYDTALICLNGHVINSRMKKYPQHNTKFCQDCGAECINKCPHCNEDIRGEYHLERVIARSFYVAPSYCDKCGKPFPWLEEKLIALDEIIDLMDELSESEKRDLKQSARDVTTENPRTSLAALKIKKFSLKVGSEIYNAVKNILVQIAVEAAKKQIGL